MSDWANGLALRFLRGVAIGSLVTSLGLTVWAANHPKPGLGAFSSPQTLTGAVSGQPWTWQGNVTLTPGSGTQRSISGVGTFVIGSPTPIPTPIPPIPAPMPPGALNVRNYGAIGDGVSDDTAACQKALSAAVVGSTIYFPAGVYKLTNSLKINTSSITLLGVGDTSVLDCAAGSYHVQIGPGTTSGVRFQSLQFLGTPGLYMADGTGRGGNLLIGCTGTVYESCLFRGCNEPINNTGNVGGVGTLNTVANNCRFIGWGRMAFFCNGGEHVTNCTFVQDDPNLLGMRSSHGIYVHGGASNVLIADSSFTNVRKYCIQAFCETAPSVTSNLQIVRCKFSNSANGVITAHGNVNAGILTNSLIDSNTFSGIYAGPALSIKDGDGLIVRNNIIDGIGVGVPNSGSGIQLGVWAPYELGFWLNNVVVTGNTVRGCQQGIWALNSNGGTFTNCTVAGNLASGNGKDYLIQGSGIAFTPGAKHPILAADLRPGL